jgi:hypothetical protein
VVVADGIHVQILVPGPSTDSKKIVFHWNNADRTTLSGKPGQTL